MKTEDKEVIFETVVGSRLYGTFTPESDTDYKGVCILSNDSEYFGIGEKFQQYHQNDLDREIYDIRKFIGMLAKNNPNIMDLVFAPEKFWIKTSPIWEELISHRDQFISKKCKNTFLGYATAQLKRIETHKKWLLNPPTEQPERSDFGIKDNKKIVRDDLMKAVESIPTEYFRDHLREDFIKEKKYQVALKEWNQYCQWKKNRNPKRAILEEKYGYDLKHAMHLIRLCRMGKEILLTGEVIVDRTEIDVDDLMEIRNGLWSYEKVVTEAKAVESEMNDIVLVSKIPDSVDWDMANQLCIDLVKKHLGL